MAKDLRSPKDLRSSGLKEFVYTQAFDTNNTSAPDGVRFPDDGTTIARTAAGTFTITFPSGKRPQALSAATAWIEGDEGDLDVKVVSYVASTGVLTLKVYQKALTHTLAAAAYTTGVAVTTDTATLGASGYVAMVEATAGTSAGVKTIQSTGSPAAGAVQVTYSAGVATLTFNATDAITETTVLVIPDDEAASLAQAAADTTDKKVCVLAVFERSSQSGNSDY